jgi:hypothetical protein
MHRFDVHLHSNDRRLAEMLDSGVISRSQSPWASAVVIMRKKDGGYRMCVDYCALNKLTRRDRYPLPRIDDTLDLLGGRIFSQLSI